MYNSVSHNKHIDVCIMCTRLKEYGEPKINSLNLRSFIGVCEQEILRLQVPVYHPMLMTHLQNHHNFKKRPRKIENTGITMTYLYGIFKNM